MPAPVEFPASFVRPWRELLGSHQAEQADDFPNHHVGNLDSLVTTSLLKSFHVGTGYSIYSRALIPAILAAQTSVHLVTCYWAASPTLDAIRHALVELASSRIRRGGEPTLLRVTICFSSRGLIQKLLHTSSRLGHVYPSSQWSSLGLPDEATLRSGGIELTVKSLFFTPLSVMHPKYVIVDARTAYVPSCNVSWESWFEGCVELEGDVVRNLLAFHQQVWGVVTDPEASAGDLLRATDATAGPVLGAGEDDSSKAGNDSASPSQSIQLDHTKAVPTIFLPSSHHRNPRFSFFPFLSQSDPPMTPLNAAILTLFANAKRSINIVTPNVTSEPVVDALIEALDRGVDVNICTSKGMMLIEQLVTAGTTTARCIRKLVSRYQTLLSRTQSPDLEAQPPIPGKLEILYFKPLMSPKDPRDEPVVSHFKMTYVDREYLVLGSGNMDRASWWTSQELGLLFYAPGFAGQALWERVRERRTEIAFQT